MCYTAIANLSLNYSFESPLNGFVQLDGSGDRELYYVWKTLNPSTGTYQVNTQNVLIIVWKWSFFIGRTETAP